MVPDTETNTSGGRALHPAMPLKPDLILDFQIYGKIKGHSLMHFSSAFFTLKIITIYIYSITHESNIIQHMIAFVKANGHYVDKRIFIYYPCTL